MSTKVGCIGAGNIVRAILTGVEKSGQYENNQIGIFDVVESVRDEFRENGYTTYESIPELVENSEVILVAVTPQVIGKITGDLRVNLTENKTILSVAAGISTEWFKENVETTAKVVRCMPILTAQAGMGSFAVSKGENVSEDEFEKVAQFLSSCGIVEIIPENLMDEVVPLNGSAPGYFYHMAKVVAEEGEAMGFDKTTALRLFAQTMKGSAETILTSGMSIETLEGKLRLPGGTTLAALDKMDELGFDECLKQGMRACAARSKELGKL